MKVDLSIMTDEEIDNPTVWLPPDDLKSIDQKTFIGIIKLYDLRDLGKTQEEIDFLFRYHDIEF